MRDFLYARKSLALTLSLTLCFLHDRKNISAFPCYLLINQFLIISNLKNLDDPSLLICTCEYT